jgi:hypothetical protein
MRALFDIIQEQVDKAKDNISQLYDDWFIETCAEWVVPYIGDLLGIGPLAKVPDQMFSLREFVGNTVALRRRKGTAMVLERLAQALTRWPAVAVEYFQLLAWTQHMNHIRIHAGGTANLADSDAMRRLGGPFEKTAHTLDVRRIAINRGRFNIPNIGEFLWRLGAFEVEDAPASPAGNTDQDGEFDYCRFRFSQLGQDLQLFNPARVKPIETRNIESDMPLPLQRRPLADQLNALRRGVEPKPLTDWDIARAIGISWTENGVSKKAEPEDICIADLENWGKPSNREYYYTSPARIAVDPVLGRFTFPSSVIPDDVTVSYWYGFSSALGGGTYRRAATETALDQKDVTRIVRVAGGDPDVGPHMLQAAIADALTEKHGVVEIGDNKTYHVSNIVVPANCTLELRAKEECRPTLVSDGPAAWTITLHTNSVLRLAGLLVSTQIQIIYGDDEEADAKLYVSHCTLVPGVLLEPDGDPVFPRSLSLEVVNESSKLQVFIERSLCGPIKHKSKFGRMEIRDSGVDGMPSRTPVDPVYNADPLPALESGVTIVERSTILGRANIYLLELGSNSIFDGVLCVLRTQDGCVRYCYMPWDEWMDSKAPWRYHCQPITAIDEAVAAAERVGEDKEAAKNAAISRVKPHYTSVRYGEAGYLQLAQSCPPEIAGGASNEAEMGIFNHLGQPQRLKNLASVLAEYLRVGLEAGIFLET